MQCQVKSLSARRAWIEIQTAAIDKLDKSVALRKESVDRNYIIKITRDHPHVALRKESVDRNSEINTRRSKKMKSLSARRAWIEMCTCLRAPYVLPVSLSARRAWIEILFAWQLATRLYVALRKESVDRNGAVTPMQTGIMVALRKESVDRNRSSMSCQNVTCCRSPQGERG